MSRCSVPNWVGSGEGRSTLPGKPTATRSPWSRQTEGFACRMCVRVGKRLRTGRAKWARSVHKQSPEEPLTDRSYMPGLSARPIDLAASTTGKEQRYE